MQNVETAPRGRRALCALALGIASLALAATTAVAQPVVDTPGASTAAAPCGDQGTVAGDVSAAALADGPLDADGAVDLARERDFDSWVSSHPATAAAATGVDIGVYVHNFYASDSQQVTLQQVLDQLVHLNAAYAGAQGGTSTRFEFVLKAYENIKVSSGTVAVTSRRGNRLKRSQHEGGATTLNVYLANRLTYRGDQISGAARFPWQVAGHPDLDGIWLRRGVLPGVAGGPSNRTEGDALVHEVGHWLGLYHVFQGYCTGTGDRVADTGRMSRSSAANTSCTARDSCTGDGGRTDPVHNFMSGSDDSCLTSFTAGQATRMSNQWDRYRG